MDVALDANIILNDPRMGGNAFQSLLDYLRRTNSRLVLSRVVLDEVIARYPELLKTKIRDASRAVGALGSIVVDSEINLPFIDVDRETQFLEQKLLQPSKNIKASHVVNTFSDICIEDVIKRGIQRIPPASAGGEELRDVIHWLMILKYLETAKSELAFITDDKHFRDEAVLHPRLEREIRDHNLPLHFYTSLDDFIKDNSPTPHNLSEPDAFGLLGKAHILDRFEIEARPFLPATLASGRVIERDARLTRGALYDVGPDSQFGELEFEAEVSTRVTTEIPIVNAVLGQPTFVSGFTMPYLVPGGLNANLDLSPMNAWKGPTKLEWPADEYNYFSEPTGAYVSPSSFISVPHHSGTFTESTSDFRVKGSIVISIRIVSGRVVNVQTERIEVSLVDKITETR
jgi:hypothetical protein